MFNCLFFCPNHKYGSQGITWLFAVRRNQMKAPCMWRRRWDLEQQKLTQWPRWKRWFLKNGEVKYIILTPAHNWMRLYETCKFWKIQAQSFITSMRRPNPNRLIILECFLYNGRMWIILLLLLLLRFGFYTMNGSSCNVLKRRAVQTPCFCASDENVCIGFMHFCTESIKVRSFVQLCLHFAHMSWYRCHRLKSSVCR